LPRCDDLPLAFRVHAPAGIRVQCIRRSPWRRWVGRRVRQGAGRFVALHVKPLRQFSEGALGSTTPANVAAAPFEVEQVEVVRGPTAFCAARCAAKWAIRVYPAFVVAIAGQTAAQRVVLVHPGVPSSVPQARRRDVHSRLGCCRSCKCAALVRRASVRTAAGSAVRCRFLPLECPKTLLYTVPWNIVNEPYNIS
jgi:hypothetical protein